VTVVLTHYHRERRFGRRGGFFGGAVRRVADRQLTSGTLKAVVQGRLSKICRYRAVRWLGRAYIFGVGGDVTP